MSALGEEVHRHIDRADYSEPEPVWTVSPRRAGYVSAGALLGVLLLGLFLIDFSEDAKARLEKVSPDAVNGCEGKDLVFHLGKHQLPFTAENFLLSFSFPNFYFHATTACDILRMRGTPLGKVDFLGQMRMKM